MKTIFGLFDSYVEAENAVDALLAGDVERADVNVLVQAETAKERMDVNMERASVDVTDEVGEEKLAGLDNLLARQQPVPVGRFGGLFAAGELATMIVRTGAQMGELATALQDFNVEGDAAQAFSDGVEHGQFLLWARVEDDHAAEVADAFRRFNGKHVGDYSSS